jgi:hypothetical protein
MIRFYFRRTPNPAQVALMLEERGLASKSLPSAPAGRAAYARRPRHQPAPIQAGKSLLRLDL